MINFGDISILKNEFLNVFSVLKTFWNCDELISKNIFDIICYICYFFFFSFGIYEILFFFFFLSSDNFCNVIVLMFIIFINLLNRSVVVSELFISRCRKSYDFSWEKELLYILCRYYTNISNNNLI